MNGNVTFMSFEQHLVHAGTRKGAIPSSAENALWVLGIFSALGGFNIILSGDQLEKSAWLTADITAVATALGSSMLYVATVRKLWPLFSWPLLTLLSTIWSLTPGLTAYHAVQLFMTMLVGVTIQHRLGMRRFIALLFVALVMGLLGSLAVIAAAPVYAISPRGEWKGIFTHKNELGLGSVLLIYTGLALARKCWFVVLPVIVLATVTLVGSRSATSLIVCAAVIAVIPFGLMLPLRFYPFAAAVSFGLAAAVLAAVSVLTDGSRVVGDVFGALGRDDTLTGRTDLWSFGWDAFLSHPVLGLGYQAYWASDATSAGYLKYFVQQELSNFHNNWLEVAVGMGVIGMVLFAAGILQVTILVIRGNRRMPGVPAVWSLMFLVHVMILTLVENPLFCNHGVMQLLLIVVAAEAIKGGGPQIVDARPHAERQLLNQPRVERFLHAPGAGNCTKRGNAVKPTEIAMTS